MRMQSLMRDVDVFWRRISAGWGRWGQENWERQQDLYALQLGEGRGFRKVGNPPSLQRFYENTKWKPSLSVQKIAPEERTRRAAARLRM
jgi:hypothetical protein